MESPPMLPPASVIVAVAEVGICRDVVWLWPAAVDTPPADELCVGCNRWRSRGETCTTDEEAVEADKPAVGRMNVGGDRWLLHPPRTRRH